MPHAKRFVTVRLRHVWIIVGVLYGMGWGLIPARIGVPLTAWLFTRLLVVGPLRGSR